MALVVSRRLGEPVLIEHSGAQIKVWVSRVRNEGGSGNEIRICIEAPQDVRIHRDPDHEQPRFNPEYRGPRSNTFPDRTKP